jgi:hypothetical protein
MAGWLLMLRFFDVLHSPSSIPVILKCGFMSEMILEMARHWSKWTLPTIEFGSLHKMHWRHGRIDSLSRWAARYSCPICNLKSATDAFCGRSGLNMSLCSNIILLLSKTTSVPFLILT